MRKNILITGYPKVGKTTLLQKVIANFINKVGFVTAEALDTYGTRIAFEVKTSQGEKAIIASRTFRTGLKPSKESRFQVDITDFEKVIRRLSKHYPKDLLFIDEIGKMQLFSNKFKGLVLNYLDSENVTLMTISKIFENEFTKSIKNRKDTILVEIDKNNWNDRLEFTSELIKKIYKAKRYIDESERFSKKGDLITLKSEHGIRKIKSYENKFSCNCDFFKKYEICSHVIAAEKVYQ